MRKRVVTPEDAPETYLEAMAEVIARQHRDFIIDRWRAYFGNAMWHQGIVACVEEDSAYVILCEPALRQKFLTGLRSEADFWCDIIAIEQFLEREQDEDGQHALEYPSELDEVLTDTAFWRLNWLIPMRACNPMNCGGVRVPVLLLGRL